MEQQLDLESRTIFIDKGITPLLDFMLEKAGYELSFLTDFSITAWINMNLDLLSEDDKVRFEINDSGIPIR